MKRELFDAETKALIEIGFIKPVDVVLLLVLVCCSILYFVRPDWSTKCLATAIFCTLFWLVALAFRTMYFVLKCTAEVKMLPAAAARLAIQFSTGGAASS